MSHFPGCHGCYSRFWNAFPDCDRACYIEHAIRDIDEGHGSHTEGAQRERLALLAEQEEIRKERAQYVLIFPGGVLKKFDKLPKKDQEKVINDPELGLTLNR
jgi:hypothetical protein